MLFSTIERDWLSGGSNKFYYIFSFFRVFPATNEPHSKIPALAVYFELS